MGFKELLLMPADQQALGGWSQNYSNPCASIIEVGIPSSGAVEKYAKVRVMNSLVLLQCEMERADDHIRELETTF